jgi:hypothetical protein
LTALTKNIYAIATTQGEAGIENRIQDCQEGNMKHWSIITGFLLIGIISTGLIVVQGIFSLHDTVMKLSKTVSHCLSNQSRLLYVLYDVAGAAGYLDLNSQRR